MTYGPGGGLGLRNRELIHLLVVKGDVAVPGEAATSAIDKDRGSGGTSGSSTSVLPSRLADSVWSRALLSLGVTVNLPPGENRFFRPSKSGTWRS